MMELKPALEIARTVWAQLSPHCVKCDIAGSIRRRKPVVKDIEMIVVPKVEQYVEETADLFAAEQIKRTRRVPGFSEVVRSLGTIGKGQPETGKYVQIILPSDIALDLFIVYPESWGYQLTIRTGSAEFSRLVAARWKRLGFVGEEGVLTRMGKPIKLETEEQLFALLLMKVPPPERRELTSEGLKPWLL